MSIGVTCSNIPCITIMHILSPGPVSHCGMSFASFLRGSGLSRKLRHCPAFSHMMVRSVCPDTSWQLLLRIGHHFSSDGRCERRLMSACPSVVSICCVQRSLPAHCTTASTSNSISAWYHLTLDNEGGITVRMLIFIMPAQAKAGLQCRLSNAHPYCFLVADML